MWKVPYILRHKLKYTHRTFTKWEIICTRRRIRANPFYLYTRTRRKSNKSRFNRKLFTFCLLHSHPHSQLFQSLSLTRSELLIHFLSVKILKTCALCDKVFTSLFILIWQVFVFKIQVKRVYKVKFEYYVHMIMRG